MLGPRLPLQALFPLISLPKTKGIKFSVIEEREQRLERQARPKHNQNKRLALSGQGTIRSERQERMKKMHKEKKRLIRLLMQQERKARKDKPKKKKGGPKKA